ncbi:uncharacterized protein BKCO1_1200026 [Diplodia corticola]|uniref:Uncharacterized protein n=1 Tax=Diplodia corticola TaxID=236234 RepID=A0A1J9R6I4_9PEZI|nr:uncharacterized protein BKCO1_1200026 [Diplodia corticola]OJD36208.1 hypothetical protein BKCO1_1200026 [Diplodia corticola]
MPPIPIFSDAPINPQTAAKPDGTTPQTAAGGNNQQPQPTPTRTTATTTAAPAAPAAFDPAAPPPPQPGAAPVPPPSAAAATAHQQQQQDAAPPPPPQPGAAPVPAPTGSSSNSSATSPPSVTKTVTETVTMMPPQFSIPAPGANAAATHSTESGSPQQQLYGSNGNGAGGAPTTINFGAVVGDGGQTTTTRTRGSSTASLEHPPGYVQNQYPDGTAAQRAALEAAAAREREEGGVWGTVKGLAATVGEGLKKADQEAWKLVGGSGK